MAQAFDRITFDPGVCSGKPCIRGTRFPVHQGVELVAAGKCFAQILTDFPVLDDEDIHQSQAAARLAREEWVPV